MVYWSGGESERVAGYWMLDVGYWMLVTCYLLLVADYWLLGKPENCPPGRAGRTGLLSIRYWIFFYCWFLDA